MVRDGTISRRMPQIDGLRAVAVFGVMYQHWFQPYLPIGLSGVMLFFVISGFLITRSIAVLRSRALSLGEAARRFFGRRAIRLFPVYYVLLAVSFLVWPEARSAWVWYATYSSNFYLALQGHWIALTPTWSLCVEEQFYIAWFFAVFLVPWKTLRSALIVMIVLAVAFRFLMLALGWGMAVYLLPGCMDALAIGALLYMAERHDWSMPEGSWMVALACLLGSFIAAAGWNANSAISGALHPLFIALAGGWALWKARSGFGGLAGRVLSWRPVTHFGEVSYGIYLYHILTGEVFRHLPVVWHLAKGGWPMFCVNVLITWAIAAVSYRVMERPLLDWRPSGRRLSHI
jgi:peptidoglycan/LPS O-acetylase OafA/YrhL